MQSLPFFLSEVAEAVRETVRNFEDCPVPEENVLGQVHQGVKILMRGLDYERVILAAGPLGILQACLEQQKKQHKWPLKPFNVWGEMDT